MASTTAAEAPAAEASDAELTIGGMTCASCAARVEKKLNRMDGPVRWRTPPRRTGPTGGRARRTPAPRPLGRHRPIPP
ncbi:heavy-metal-associated domain-containing protein, partial [Streptomyces sp.]|uniref:heavy-metal-associated domain-containing protein n=1 Tax=Streptomyces sp. TaxID=1931 RepID=UPI0039C9EFC5